jgi:hypothetical protein
MRYEDLDLELEKIYLLDVAEECDLGIYEFIWEYGICKTSID